MIGIVLNAEASATAVSAGNNYYYFFNWFLRVEH